MDQQASKVSGVNKKDLVNLLLKNNVVIDTEILNEINKIPELTKFYNLIKSSSEAGVIDITKDNLLNLIIRFQDHVNKKVEKQLESQKYNNSTEQSRNNSSQQSSQLNKQSPNVVTTSTGAILPDPEVKEGTVRVDVSYDEEPKKRTVQDFVSYFNARYNMIKKILVNRKELVNPTSISRIRTKRDRNEVSVIGLISNKQVTKNDNVIFTIEDPTDTIKVLINKNKPEMLELAKNCVLDEVVGIVGNCGDNIIFANKLLFPDIPIYKELKKAPDEAYALFLGDPHFGSKYFLHEGFAKFINWLKGDYGNEAQRAMARKVRYVVIPGDLVEGVGIYPSQENDLEVTDIYEQYNKLVDYMKMIPQHIKLIICPGNHDAMRIAEPQPPLYKDFAKSVWELPNATLVSNPAVVNIHASEDFPGFDLLMYHGFSFIYYGENVEKIRAAGGQKKM